MALLWFDGFASYSGADMEDVNNPVFSSIDSREDYIFYSTSYGRDGRYGMFINYHDRYVKYYFSGTYTTFIMGMAIKRINANVPSYSAGYPLIGFYDGSTLQSGLYVVGSEIHAYGPGGKLGESSGASINEGVWCYIEVKVTIDNSSGLVIVRSNENVILNLSGKDTQSTANAYFDGLFINGIYPVNGSYYADLYMCDTSGTKCNDFLGDIRVDALRPGGAGTYTDFTPSAGSNYQNADEDYPDDDTTYNDGSNVADQDSYALEDLPSPAGTTIYGVKSQITVRKTDVGSRECKLLTRAGTTDDLGDTIVLSDSFTTHTKIFEDNPDDSADWEDADVNGMEVGVEITE